MKNDRQARLEALLHARGSQPTGVIATELGVSQPTVSRLIAAAGSRIVRIGRARATRYALAREIGRAGSHWPLYRIDAAGKPQSLGELHALVRDQFHFDANSALPAFLHGDFASGLCRGLPWFLDDQRPQGFLGRLFAHGVAEDIGAPADVQRWSAADIVLGLLRYGHDAPGDLVLGEASLQRALRGIVAASDGITLAQRATRYPQLADAVLGGEDVGSSAGGEQPKFTATLLRDGASAPVIVKFSDRVDTPGGRRWADLLIAEQIAGETLRKHGLPAADSEIVEADDRVFLQATRFDRTPERGRRGFVSLAALDAAYFGHGSIDWWRFAPGLERGGWIDAVDAQRLGIISWFGLLIANTDMHLGNAALHLTDARPLALAPVYDMLPMRFRPASNGEVIERSHEPALPAPEQRNDWLEASSMALHFWQRVIDESRISPSFRAIATDANRQLEQALRHLG